MDGSGKGAGLQQVEITFSSRRSPTSRASTRMSSIADIIDKEKMAASRHVASIATKRAQEQHYLGEWMASDAALKGESIQKWMEHQSTMQCLYEGRMASLERFVSFVVIFHTMGKRVQDWWPSVSCGLLGYDMSRSHSIMRIATTASPVSGSDVRVKMIELAEKTAGIAAERIIGNRVRMHLKVKKERAYRAYKAGLADLTKKEVAYPVQRVQGVVQGLVDLTTTSSLTV